MSYVKRKIDLIKKNERKSNGDSKEPEVNTLVINVYVALPVMVANMCLFSAFFHICVQQQIMFYNE
jgi:hypothetical protein